MIFIAGVHGVGKSTFAERLERKAGIKCYRASALIESGGNRTMPVNKEISNIAGNQKVLEREVGILVAEQGLSVLEGHLCLINAQGDIVKIPLDTFVQLHLEALWVLTDDVEEIVKRNYGKSSLLSSAEFMGNFQKQEIAYGREIAEYLTIPFDIIKDHESGIQKIKEYVKGKAYRGINPVID